MRPSPISPFRLDIPMSSSRLWETWEFHDNKMWVQFFLGNPSRQLSTMGDEIEARKGNILMKGWVQQEMQRLQEDPRTLGAGHHTL